MSTTTLADQVAKDAAVHKAIEDALKNLEEHHGQEGFRHL